MRPATMVAVLVAALIAGASARTVQPPPTRVPPERTQPPASELLDYAALTRKLEALAKHPRVRVVSIGTTVQGRAIPMAIVTETPFDHDALAARARAISGPTIAGATLASRTVTAVDLERQLADTRVPVVLAGASWGHEAAQVEGLVEAVEALATDERPQTAVALRKVVALFVPLMNPDGREAAIAEWRRTPLSTGDSGVGNAEGFMINRDFVHQTQPESQAMLDLTRRWRPVVGVDMHEDMYTLGVAIPEVAFVPPFMPGVDVEEHPATRRAIARLGGAIAAKWRAAGFRVAHDPDGTLLFAPMPPPGPGAMNPVAGSSGRLEFLWAIHGITSYITESGRTPGNQSWQDRVAQKRIAALTTIDEVAADPGYFAKVVYERRRSAAEEGPAGGRFVIIPHAQPEGASLDELRRLLLAHEVEMFEAQGLAADVVPLAQPEGAFVRHALLAERSALNDLPSALGVRIRRDEELPAEERARFTTATLTRCTGAVEAWPAAARRTTRIGVLRGQGFDGAAPGEIAFVLRRLGFEPIWLGPDQVATVDSAKVDAIVVPDGEPGEILNGIDLQAPGRRAPWQPAETPRGIGARGLESLATWVRAGGRLVLLGRSVALAGPTHGRLVDLALAEGTAARPGLGQVRLVPTPGGRWLFRGVPAGEGGEVRAFMSAPPGAGASYVFRLRQRDGVMATFAGPVMRPGDRSFVDPAALTPGAGWTAVGAVRVGGGMVVLFGVAPTFRAQWRATFPFVTNAIVGSAL